MTGDTGKSPLVGHENKPAPTAPTEEPYVGSVSLAAAANIMPVASTVITDPRSHAVAESLISISRKVNNKLDVKFAYSQTQVMDKRGRTIWDIGYGDFRTIMHGVFTSLDKSVVERSSGWEMAALVYRGVAGLARDLRQQSRDQNHGSRAREGTLQSYVGNFLEEVGLMTWITGQGGLVSIPCLINYLGAINRLYIIAL